ncbi:MAG: hypothetical protein LBU50_06435 [Cellulomonas sp.]|nr:hypothetical protein [Cellulomonas sp.]
MDDSGDRAVLIDPTTGDETLFTGLSCVWNGDGSIGSYEVYVDGIGVGQWVDFHLGGGVKRIRNSDGTFYEFYESGALERVAHYCAGSVGAWRRFAEDGQVLENQMGSRGGDLSGYLHMGVGRFPSAERAKRLVFPDEYVVNHGQDVGSLDAAVAQDWSGLAFARHGDGSLAGYEFRVRGVVVGQWVRFFPGGAVEQLGGAMGARDGTCWEFYPSGAQRRVSSWCMGQLVAVRELDEDQNVTDEQGLVVWDSWDGYLDWAVRG